MSQSNIRQPTIILIDRLFDNIQWDRFLTSQVLFPYFVRSFSFPPFLLVIVNIKWDQLWTGWGCHWATHQNIVQPFRGFLPLPLSYSWIFILLLFSGLKRYQRRNENDLSIAIFSIKSVWTVYCSTWFSIFLPGSLCLLGELDPVRCSSIIFALFFQQSPLSSIFFFNHGLWIFSSWCPTVLFLCHRLWIVVNPFLVFHCAWSLLGMSDGSTPLPNAGGVKAIVDWTINDGKIVTWIPHSVEKSITGCVTPHRFWFGRR